MNSPVGQPGITELSGGDSITIPCDEKYTITTKHI